MVARRYDASELARVLEGGGRVTAERARGGGMTVLVNLPRAYSEVRDAGGGTRGGQVFVRALPSGEREEGTTTAPSDERMTIRCGEKVVCQVSDPLSRKGGRAPTRPAV
jgi:hypothetical protein